MYTYNQIIVANQERTVYMLDDDSIGNRLKILRRAKKMTAKEVAEKAGVSAAYISMLENGKSNYNLKILLKLVNIYGETLSDFLQTAHSDDRIRHLEDMKQLSQDKHKLDYRVLRCEGDPDIFRPYYFQLEPGGDTEMSKHTGTEYIFVIEGSVVLTLIDPESGKTERYQLHQTDSIYYSSAWFHGTKNESDGNSKFILIYSPYTQEGDTLLKGAGQRTSPDETAGAPGAAQDRRDQQPRRAPIRGPGQPSA